MKFNKLTVIDINKEESLVKKRTIWNCLCDCGKLTTSSTTRLKSGTKKTCGCEEGGKVNIKDVTGMKFNRLTALSFNPEKSGKTRYREWDFKCDCGKTITLRLSRAVDGRTKSCGCYNDEKRRERATKAPGVAALNQIYYMYKYNAKRRGIEFDLSKEEFYEIGSKNCYYCDVEPRMVHGVSSIFYIPFNGIDRTDSLKRYVRDNCVACCPTCNIMKNDSTLEEFKNQIVRIYNGLCKID